jgi:hypothetical protein
MKISYNERAFRSVINSESGDVGAETVFRYHQEGTVVWAEYSGGDVVRGQLIAVCAEDGTLDMNYQHINADGELMAGTCISRPEIMNDGRLRLYEKWRWTRGDTTAGESVIEEVVT